MFCSLCHQIFFVSVKSPRPLGSVPRARGVLPSGRLLPSPRHIS